MTEDFSEVFKYLGYKKTDTPDEETCKRVLSCMKKLKEKCSPKTTYKRFPVTYSEGKICVAGMKIESQYLLRNIEGCDEAFLLAATIGPEVDRLILKAESLSMADAVIYQACGAAYVEEVVDKLNNKLKDIAALENKKTRQRFSPGYGDFSLKHQADFSAILDMPKSVGITLTDTFIMRPSKSVTAIVGIDSK